MNELVRLSTNDVGKAIPITDTEVVAVKLGVKTKSLNDMIVRYADDFKEFGKLTRFKIARDSQRSTTAFELNESQFMVLVTYSKNTEKARYWKRQFVKQFINMRTELLVRVETRQLGISVRKELTDSIKNYVTDEGKFKNFAYSTYSKLVYKKVLGMTVKKAKEEKKVPKNGKLRDYLTLEELKKVHDLESKIATYIEFTDNADKTDKEIYQDVKNYIEK